MINIKSPIFLLNAPKGCGKDTVALHMNNLDSSIRFDTFKFPIEEIFLSTVPDLVAGEYNRFYDDRDSNWKDTPNPLIGGHTPRELFIHIGERFIKPFFGDEYFGDKLVERINIDEQMYGEEFTWVIPDCGFDIEVAKLYEAFPDRVVVVKFTRDGFESFTGDSRGFVQHPDATMVQDTNNDGSESLALRLMGFIDYDQD